MSSGNATAEDDRPFCRICHDDDEEEEEEDLQFSHGLKRACKCTGSLAYVHQSCLKQWLATSRRKKCDVCGYEFKFAPVYTPDAPNTLPLLGWIEALFLVCFRYRWQAIRSTFALCLWSTFPYLASFCFRLWLHPETISPWADPSISRMNWRTMAWDWLYGGVIIVVGIFTVSIVYSVVAFAVVQQRMWLMHDAHERRNAVPTQTAHVVVEGDDTLTDNDDLNENNRSNDEADAPDTISLADGGSQSEDEAIEAGDTTVGTEYSSESDQAPRADAEIERDEQQIPLPAHETQHHPADADVPPNDAARIDDRENVDLLDEFAMLGEAPEEMAADHMDIFWVRQDLLKFLEFAISCLVLGFALVSLCICFPISLSRFFSIATTYGRSRAIASVVASPGVLAQFEALKTDMSVISAYDVAHFIRGILLCILLGVSVTLLRYIRGCIIAKWGWDILVPWRRHSQTQEFAEIDFVRRSKCAILSKLFFAYALTICIEPTFVGLVVSFIGSMTCSNARALWLFKIINQPMASFGYMWCTGTLITFFSTTLMMLLRDRLRFSLLARFLRRPRFRDGIMLRTLERPIAHFISHLPIVFVIAIVVGSFTLYTPELLQMAAHTQTVLSGESLTASTSVSGFASFDASDKFVTNVVISMRPTEMARELGDYVIPRPPLTSTSHISMVRDALFDMFTPFQTLPDSNLYKFGVDTTDDAAALLELASAGSGYHPLTFTLAPSEVGKHSIMVGVVRYNEVGSQSGFNGKGAAIIEKQTNMGDVWTAVAQNLYYRTLKIDPSLVESTNHGSLYANNTSVFEFRSGTGRKDTATSGCAFTVDHSAVISAETVPSIEDKHNAGQKSWFSRSWFNFVPYFHETRTGSFTTSQRSAFAHFLDVLIFYFTMAHLLDFLRMLVWILVSYTLTFTATVTGLRHALLPPPDVIAVHHPNGKVWTSPIYGVRPADFCPIRVDIKLSHSSIDHSKRRISSWFHQETERHIGLEVGMLALSSSSAVPDESSMPMHLLNEIRSSASLRNQRDAWMRKLRFVSTAANVDSAKAGKAWHTGLDIPHGTQQSIGDIVQFEHNGVPRDRWNPKPAIEGNIFISVARSVDITFDGTSTSSSSSFIRKTLRDVFTIAFTFAVLGLLTLFAIGVFWIFVVSATHLGEIVWVSTGLPKTFIGPLPMVCAGMVAILYLCGCLLIGGVAVSIRIAAILRNQKLSIDLFEHLSSVLSVQCRDMVLSVCFWVWRNLLSVSAACLAADKLPASSAQESWQELSKTIFLAVFGLPLSIGICFTILWNPPVYMLPQLCSLDALNHLCVFFWHSLAIGVFVMGFVCLITLLGYLGDISKAALHQRIILVFRHQTEQLSNDVLLSFLRSIIFVALSGVVGQIATWLTFNGPSYCTIRAISVVSASLPSLQAFSAEIVSCMRRWKSMLYDHKYILGHDLVEYSQ